MTSMRINVRYRGLGAYKQGDGLKYIEVAFRNIRTNRVGVIDLTSIHPTDIIKLAKRVINETNI